MSFEDEIEINKNDSSHLIQIEKTMKHSIKKMWFTMLVAFVSLSVYSANYHFVYEGLYYHHAYSDDECWLGRNPDDPYAGKINVPETVVDEQGRTLKVVAIVDAAFYNCVHLTEVTLPATITSINDASFEGCTALKSISLPEDIRDIGHSCFDGCTSLKSITLPGSLTDRMGNRLFKNCTALEKVKMMEGITVLPEEIFDGCTALTTLDIPSTVHTIGNNALNCGITSINLPAGLKNIGMMNCANLTALNLPEGLEHFGGINNSAITELSLPRYITSISKSMFSNNTLLKTVKAASPIASIGAHAFTGCEALVELPSLMEVESVGRYAFNYCKSLRELIFSDKLREIGKEEGADTDGIAIGCTGLERVELGSRLESIPPQCFVNCTNLKRITIPAACRNIGTQAFYGCTALEQVDMPESLTTMGVENTNGITGNVFHNCISLKNIVIPEGIETLENLTFAACSSLASVKLPSTLKHIKNSVFKESSIQEIELPIGLETIGNEAFRFVNALKGISIPHTVKKLGDSWLYGENIQEVTFCDGKDAIEVESSLAEYELISLKNLYLGRNIHANFDGYYILSNHALESIVLGSYVTDARFVAFPHMDHVTAKNLTSLISKSLTPPLVTGFSEHLYSKITPTIDAEAHEDYRNTEHWKEFPAFSLQNELSAIDTIESGITEKTAYYNLSGIYVGSSTQFLQPGIYVKCCGKKRTKILVQ